MKKSDIMVYSVLLFVVMEALCFVIVSLLNPAQAQVTWNSQVVNYPIGNTVTQKEVTVFDGDKFVKKTILDTIKNNTVDIDIVRLDSVHNLKPTVNRDTSFKVYQPPPALWNKCSEKQKREWCERTSIALLEGCKVSQRVYEYLFNYSKYAIYEYNATGILASGTLAQALLESGDGTSSLTTTHNNHFGIKCHEWKKKKVWYKDDCHGKPCCFRAYKNDAESYHDHSNLLLNNRRYKAVVVAKTPMDYVKAIGKSGYATSLSYRSHLTEKIEKYKLFKFDVNFNTSYWKYNSDKPSNPISSW